MTPKTIHELADSKDWGWGGGHAWVMLVVSGGLKDHAGVSEHSFEKSSLFQAGIVFPNPARREKACLSVCVSKRDVSEHYSPTALIHMAWNTLLSDALQPIPQPDGEKAMYPSGSCCAPFSVYRHTRTTKYHRTYFFFFSVIPTLFPISVSHFLKPTKIPGRSPGFHIS